MTATEIRLESALPDGWIPEGAAVHVFARLNEDGQWESVIPEFTIAGLGGTLDEAMSNAVELLDDYLLLCARDGRSFYESFRPFGWSLRWAMLRDFVSAATSAWRRLRHENRQGRSGRGKTHAQYKVPLRMLGVH